MIADFTFKGNLVCESFLGFARHRAARLDLQLDIARCDDASARMSVTGAEALVDMFEMACSLGPYDCLITDIERTDRSS
ncbi:hypothetical protein J5J10_20005 [Ciceribacter sp. L1K23]|uniref:hypothetical protein n=1 Tax=Ciceribacter sp. L1K23 TaxID=2820276 RepID=UPI001B845DE3|nr:hypothetical protein [Ciceribacter sp. L1K23]MBR0557981.1 hypothetical protein [Ciceribacter sp. L1K23]